jgi:DNA-binding NarL/FixJ family response regulator
MPHPAGLCDALQPDVVLTDIELPELNAIEATRRIATTSPHIAVPIITMFEDAGSAVAAMCWCARLRPRRDLTD